MEKNKLKKRLRLLSQLIKTRKKLTTENLKYFTKEYYGIEDFPEEFYDSLKNNLTTYHQKRILNIILKGNIYELISYLKNNNESVEKLDEFITPQKYFEIPRRNINKIIEVLRSLSNKPNQLYDSTKDETIWLLKRNPLNTENEYREIAYKMYQSIGFENTLELLMQKYGDITYEQIYFMFSRLNTRKGLNETAQQAFVNFLFGNKKDFNNTIRQMLAGRFQSIFLNFDYFYNDFTKFIEQLGTKMTKLKVNKLLNDRFLSHDIATPEITGDILDDMLSSYYCKYDSLDTPQDDVYKKNYDAYNEYLKNKYQSSIPRISLSSNDGITGEILKLSDPRNLVLGYRTGNCFRINGAATNLFNQFLKSEHMRLLSLSTPEYKDFAMMLIMRNGNVLIGQGIEISERIPQTIQREKIYDLCRDTLKQLMDYANSQGDEIVATVIGRSNSNVSNYNNQVLPFLVPPILETQGNFYNGIYNYQCLLDIKEGSTLYDIKLYTPSARYPDERENILIRDYKALNYDEYMEMEKRLRALRFTRLKEQNNPEFYIVITSKQELYTSCNKDWYITLFEDGTIDSYISSQSDPRVQEEYNSEMKKIYTKVNKKTNE